MSVLLLALILLLGSDPEVKILVSNFFRQF